MEKLLTEYETLHLVYHRNANQHRSSSWWKTFNVLHRKLRQLLLLWLDQREFAQQGSVSRLQWDKLGRIHFKSQRLKRQPSPRAIGKLARWMLNELMPKCILMSYTVIEMGQFIALGFTLEAMSARIYDGLKKVVAESNLAKLKPDSGDSKAVLQVASAIGETEPAGSAADRIVLTQDAENDGWHLAGKRKTKTTPTSGRKKKHSAKKTMDDIFG